MTCPSTTIQTQWRDMRVKANGNELWRKINLDKTIPECLVRYGDLKSSIEDAACALGVELFLRVQPLHIATMHSYRLGKRGKSIEKTPGVLGDVLFAAEVTELEDERPNKLCRTRSTDNTRGTFLESQSSSWIITSVSTPVGGGTPLAPRRASSTYSAT